MKQKRILVVLLVSAMVSMGSIVWAETNKPKVLNIKTYGAIGDGVTLNTEALQKTIDAYHAAGGGVVWVEGTPEAFPKRRPDSAMSRQALTCS